MYLISSFYRWGRVEWTTYIKRNTVRSTTWLLRWGLFWAGVVTLTLPPNIYIITRYFLSIPFFILLFPWVNDIFTTLAAIFEDYFRRKNYKSIAKQQQQQDLFSEKNVEIGPEFNDDLDGNEVWPLKGEDTDDWEESIDNNVQDLLQNKRAERSDAFLSALGEFLRVLKYIAFLFIFVLGLEYNNVPVVQLLEDVSIFTISIVFAAQPWIRNLIGGLQNIIGDKFVVGDTIRVVGVEGKVKKLTLRSIVLEVSFDITFFCES